MQVELLTGGILTNAFRPKRIKKKDGTLSDYENQIVFYVDSKAKAEEAAMYLKMKPEVLSVETNHPDVNVDLWDIKECL